MCLWSQLKIVNFAKRADMAGLVDYLTGSPRSLAHSQSTDSLSYPLTGPLTHSLTGKVDDSPNIDKSALIESAPSKKRPRPQVSE